MRVDLRGQQLPHRSAGQRRWSVPGEHATAGGYACGPLGVSSSLTAALVSAWLGTSGWMGSRLIQQSACKLGTAGDYAYRAARPAAGQGSGTDSPTVAGQGKGDCCRLPGDFAFE